MSGAHTPGPWVVETGYRRSVYFVCRSMGNGFMQYLGTNGKAKANPSYFRSRDAAETAIAKATGATP